MKELRNKVIDDFIAKNDISCRRHFNYNLLQDFCHRISVTSAYSRYLNDRYQFQDRSHEAKDPAKKMKEDHQNDIG